MKVGEFFTEFSKQAGIDSNNEGLKSLLMNIELAKVEIPDELSKPLSERYSSMITLETAKQSPELKNHFFAQALNGLDADTARSYEEMGVPKDVIENIWKAEKSSAKKQLAVMKAIQEIEAKKIKLDPSDKEKHQKYQDEIAALNHTILAEKAAKDNELMNVKKEYSSKLKDYSLTSALSKYEYSELYPASIRLKMAKSLLEDQLTKDNCKIVFEEESGNIGLLTNADTKLYRNNKEVGFDEFLNTTLADNKMLKTATAPPKPGEKPVININAGGTVNTSRMQQALEESAAGFAQQN